MILIIMGVAGSGKTTIGSALAESLSWEFLDGDDFHSAENVEKMRRGIPLTDADRAGWLANLAGLIKERLDQDCNSILACSALKQSYRDLLSTGDEWVKIVYLKGSRKVIAERMHARPGHYMQPGMLDSQFEILEEPLGGLIVDINQAPAEIVRQLIAHFGLCC